MGVVGAGWRDATRRVATRRVRRIVRKFEAGDIVIVDRGSLMLAGPSVPQLRSENRVLVIPERRGIQRIRMHCPVSVATDDGLSAAFLTDVSEDGAQLELLAATLPTLGQSIQIFAADQGVLSGVVCWSGQRQCGVRFFERAGGIEDILDSDYMGIWRIAHVLGWQRLSAQSKDERVQPF